MASCHDVAAFVLGKMGDMTTMKLQKLVYYCQAWSLVWEEKPLFPEKIEAWANGPVVPVLYEAHRGMFRIDKWPLGNPANLAPEEIGTIEAVLKFYGEKSSQWLSDLTHSEAPWLDARAGLAPGERGTKEITLAAIYEYYSSL